MRYKGHATLRTGEELTLRSLCEEDAPDAIRVGRQAAGETKNLMRYPDEWTITPEREREVIRDAENGPASLMLGAFLHGELIGMGSFLPVSTAGRARHRASVGVAVLRAHWRQGVGEAMLRALIGAARETALEQLELETVSANEGAIRLYERHGFSAYGLLPRALKYRDGGYADFVLMRLALGGG